MIMHEKTARNAALSFLLAFDGFLGFGFSKIRFGYYFLTYILTYFLTYFFSSFYLTGL